MWKQELLFVKRDANGVIVGISDQTPGSYGESTKRQPTPTKRGTIMGKRFWPAADK